MWDCRGQGDRGTGGKGGKGQGGQDSGANGRRGRGGVGRGVRGVCKSAQRSASISTSAHFYTSEVVSQPLTRTAGESLRGFTR